MLQVYPTDVHWYTKAHARLGSFFLLHPSRSRCLAPPCAASLDSVLSEIVNHPASQSSLSALSPARHHCYPADSPCNFAFHHYAALFHHHHDPHHHHHLPSPSCSSSRTSPPDSPSDSQPCPPLFRSCILSTRPALPHPSRGPVCGVYSHSHPHHPIPSLMNHCFKTHRPLTSAVCSRLPPSSCRTYIPTQPLRLPQAMAATVLKAASAAAAAAPQPNIKHSVPHHMLQSRYLSPLVPSGVILELTLFHQEPRRNKRL